MPATDRGGHNEETLHRSKSKQEPLKTLKLKRFETDVKDDVPKDETATRRLEKSALRNLDKASKEKLKPILPSEQMSSLPKRPDEGQTSVRHLSKDD